MPELEPITREEKFLNGEVGMTPITREEKILAGEDIETVTRREYFLKKYRGGGGGDITVEEITITENGTTTAPSGKAYSPIHTNVPQPTLSTLEVSENGDYDAPSGTAYNRVEVDVPLPTNAYLLKSVANLPQPIATFKDGADAPIKSLKVAIEPQQDLHGYDAPWVGGAGKNKLPLTVDRIKANNTNGTWNGNVYTESGVTFTLETNDGGNITGIKVNGTASANVYLVLSQDELNYITFDGSYVVSGCSNGSPTTYALQVYSNESSGVRIDNFNEGNYIQSLNSSYTVKSVMLVIRSGCTARNLMFKPMIRLTSVTDETFEPYSNICPISGWDEVDLTVADDVETPTVENVYTIDLDGTRYGGELDVVNGVLTLTHGYIASYNGETLPSTWISDRDVYAEGTTPTIGAEVIYELATPTTYQLTPIAVKSLLGQNNVWADTGDITDAEYFSKEV